MNEKKANLGSKLLVGTLVATTYAYADPTVPGFTVETYAELDNPAGISFDPSTGVLFVGFCGEYLTSPVRRVGPGGSPVVDFGPVLEDPDFVLFDAGGLVSGTPGAVLVGNGLPHPVGEIVALLPDGAEVTVCASNEFTNPNGLTFDNDGNLLVADHFQDTSGKVLRGSGGCPGTLFTHPSRTSSVCVDNADLIYTSDTDGTINIHDSSGQLLNDAFVTGLGGGVQLVFGPGDTFWGDDLYTVRLNTGELLRIDEIGTVSVIGTGFGAGGLTFGPDGALYLALFYEDRIMRVAPPSSPCDGDANGDGTVDPLDSGYVQARFGCEVGIGDPECDTADVNTDGVVDPLDVGFVLARFGACF